MSKLFLFMMVSLDGFIEGENHDLSWHNVDEEFNTFAARQMEEMGAIVFGRRTYELMHDYWPTAQPHDPHDKLVTNMMNTLPKIVVSHSLKKVEEEENWKHISVIHNNLTQEITQFKGTLGKPLAVLGSNNLCVTLLENNLLDELRIMINPTVIGKGTPLFAGINHKKNFQLGNTRKFNNGNVLVTYNIKTS